VVNSTSTGAASRQDVRRSHISNFKSQITTVRL
jgi:hypothetical protein